MKTRTKLITLALAALLLATLIPSLAFAQGGDPGDKPASPMRALIEAAADVLGLDQDAFLAAMKEGKTPADLAAEAGVSAETLNGALIDAWNAQGPAVVERFTNEGPPKPPQHDKRPDRQRAARHFVRIAAETVGMEPADFAEALKAGDTPAQIAEANGSSGQAIIDAIVADAQTHLAEAVADGKITQEQADQRLAELTDKVTEWVNNGPPARPDGPGGPRRPGSGA